MKYTLQFTTKIRGEVTVEAASEDEANEIGIDMAEGTVNYDELTDGGACAPDVESDFENAYIKKENRDEAED